MRWQWVMRSVLLAALGAALMGCGGGNSWDPEVLPWIHDIQGTYQAREIVGEWGRVALQLERINHSRAYDATLANPQFEMFRTRAGIGTLANDHVILNFDTGLDSDFYFEGDVVIEGDLVRGLSGQFVFPDQEQTLPVVFDLL
jgi:hypothetical protein